jgi:hypothetical protein
MKMKDEQMKDEQVIIRFIRKYAMDNYTKGWDVVIECFEDGDILEFLSESDFDLPKTIKSMQNYVDAYKEQENSIRNEIF